MMLAVLIAAILRKPDTEWTPSGRDRMRRRINGEWQFRPMTDEEWQEWQDRRAW